MALSNLAYQVVLDASLEAAEDLAPYTAVVKDGNGKAAYPASDGDKIYGIVVDQYGQGEEARIIVDGIVPAKVTTASTLSAGDYVMADTAGGLITGTTTNEQAAILKTAPAADGDIVQVRVSDLINGTFA